MELCQEEIRVKGKTLLVEAVRINGNVIILTGRLIRIGRVKDEWYQIQALENPEFIVETLKKNVKADVFTFMQRLPDIEPKYDYTMQLESIAALSVKSYEHWWTKQAERNVRKSIRKAEKMGVVVRPAIFDDDFARGIADIYNETPIRQGKPFWHYGKDFETIKNEASTYLDRSEFVGAYHENELIGFIKMVYIHNCASMMHIISKFAHREKAPDNALLAKAIEICGQKEIRYLYFGEWSGGTLGDFKRYNGFEKVDIPRYYIPLTVLGKAALKLNLHLGPAGILPGTLVTRLSGLKKRWYELKYRKDFPKSHVE